MSEKAPVRNTDPWTSHAAALDVGSTAATVRARVLALFNAAPEAADGLTHDGTIALYRKYAVRLGWPPASDSSIRTRVSELVRLGDVERVPVTIGQSKFGRAAILWRAVPVQKEEADQ